MEEQHSNNDTARRMEEISALSGPCLQLDKLPTELILEITAYLKVLDLHRLLLVPGSSFAGIVSLNDFKIVHVSFSKYSVWQLKSVASIKDCVRKSVKQIKIFCDVFERYREITQDNDPRLMTISRALPRFPNLEQVVLIVGKHSRESLIDDVVKICSVALATAIQEVDIKLQFQSPQLHAQKHLKLRSCWSTITALSTSTQPGSSKTYFTPRVLGVPVPHLEHDVLQQSLVKSTKLKQFELNGQGVYSVPLLLINFLHSPSLTNLDLSNLILDIRKLEKMLTQHAQTLTTLSLSRIILVLVQDTSTTVSNSNDDDGNIWIQLFKHLQSSLHLTTLRLPSKRGSLFECKAAITPKYKALFPDTRCNLSPALTLKKNEDPRILDRRYYSVLTARGAVAHQPRASWVIQNLVCRGNVVVENGDEQAYAAYLQSLVPPTAFPGFALDAYAWEDLKRAYCTVTESRWLLCRYGKLGRE